MNKTIEKIIVKFLALFILVALFPIYLASKVRGDSDG